jgi:hypothetical protein
MSFIKDLESFASKFEKEIENLWAKAPSIETIISTTLTYVGPILETVVTIEGGAAAGTAVTTVINTAEEDLIAAKALTTTIGATPSLAGLISGVATNLSGLLAAAKVTDPKSVANVTLVVKELEALVASIPATPAA